MTRFAVCLLLLAAAACTSRRAQEDTSADTETIAPVVAQPVTTGSLRAVVHASGVITPAQGAEFLVTAPEAATVADVTRNEGEAVTSGDVLVRFDLPGANDSVARQRAEVARTQALLENARIAQSRARDLSGRGFISRRELENADRELADAQAEVGRAQAALAASESAAARAIVRAPFSGIVARRLHNPGDLVQGAATDPVLRLVDPRRLEITATVPAEDASRVLQGATARLAAAAEATPVRLLVSSPPAPGTTSTGDHAVRLTFVDPVTLQVDSAVEVDIDAEERTNVVLIPAEALLTEGSGNVVFVAIGARAVRRPVSTGIVDEERAEITSGLKPGELLITQGHASLTDGAAISVDIR